MPRDDSCANIGPSPEPCFRRGDTNNDTGFDLTDPVNYLQAAFIGRGEITCPDAADTNDDGRLGVPDAIFSLLFLFRNGEVPPSPGPYNCGPDPTPDVLADCEYLAECDFDPTFAANQ